MLNIQQDFINSIQAMRQEIGYTRLITVLEQEFEHCVKGLMTADQSKVQQIQGKAKFINELLELLKK